jgi:hypothetical protein
MLNSMRKSCGRVVDTVRVNCVSVKTLFTYVAVKIQAMFISQGVCAPKPTLVSNNLYSSKSHFFNQLISRLPTTSTPIYNNNYYLLILNYCYL